MMGGDGDVSLLEVVESVCFVKFLRRFYQLKPIRIWFVSFIPVVFDHGVPQQQTIYTVNTTSY